MRARDLKIVRSDATVIDVSKTLVYTDQHLKKTYCKMTVNIRPGTDRPLSSICLRHLFEFISLQRFGKGRRALSVKEAYHYSQS